MEIDAHRGSRIRTERERLGLSQQKAADAAGVRREMWAKYEAGAEPGAKALAGMAAAGADVLFVLTGERTPGSPGLDVSEQLLVDNYRRCKPDGKAHLVQTSALLAAGIDTAAARPRSAKSAESGTRQTSKGANAVQVAHAGGNVTVERVRR